MAIYAIGDLHLALSVNKPMDIFGGWKDYHRRIEENWHATVKPDDTVVIAGDISWAMGLEQSLKDFAFIQSLPGKKLLVKGNHDYWWTTRSKMEKYFAANCLDSLQIIHNSCVLVGEYALCGSRGWMLEDGDTHDEKISAREALRLEASLIEAQRSGKQPIVFMHYPVVFGEQIAADLLDIMLKYEVKECYYGHLHGTACKYAFEGAYLGINFKLISADHLGFKPMLIKP